MLLYLSRKIIYTYLNKFTHRRKMYLIMIFFKGKCHKAVSVMDSRKKKQQTNEQKQKIKANNI